MSETRDEPHEPIPNLKILTYGFGGVFRTFQDLVSRLALAGSLCSQVDRKRIPRAALLIVCATGQVWGLVLVILNEIQNTNLSLFFLTVLLQGFLLPSGMVILTTAILTTYGASTVHISKGWTDSFAGHTCVPIVGRYFHQESVPQLETTCRRNLKSTRRIYSRNVMGRSSPSLRITHVI